MIKKGKRVERKVTSGIMLTGDELRAAIETERGTKNFDYETEVPVYLKKITKIAYDIGMLPVVVMVMSVV